MHLVKLQIQDLEKLITEIRKSKRAAYLNVSMDGPLLKFSFENSDGRLETVTLFDESMRTAPTVTETRSI